MRCHTLLLSLLLDPSAAMRLAASRVAVPARAGRLTMGRKPGVSEPADISAFVAAAGESLIVLDVRNPDYTKEPGARVWPR